MLSVFADGFCHSPIELRITDKPGAERGLSYRFVELDTPMDPFQVARESGLLPRSDRPIDRLVPEITARFPVQGWGVDAEVAYGLEKMWPFLAHAHPLSELLALPSLPASARSLLPRIGKHGLSHFSIIAADYRRETVNVYFMATPDAPLSTALVEGLIQEFGLIGSPEWVAYAASGVALNFTFSYTSSEVERLCIYVPAPVSAALPKQLDPALRRLTDSAPLAASARAFIVGPTFTPNGMYTKLELDYTGTILGVLMRCAQVQPIS